MLAARLNTIYENFCLDARVPGLVHGRLLGGAPAEIGTVGVADLRTAAPVTSTTAFRIASMTKAFTAFTILRLRDEGCVNLDAPVADYVTELRGWPLPVSDARPIRVRDLLHHTAGFVTDDPWGDRQNPLPEAGFSALLAQGIPFHRPPGVAYEYSNLGYALLGRIIVNQAGGDYAAAVRSRVLAPLGMQHSGFDPEAYRDGERALGYRWEAQSWRPEPQLGHGTFSAMGGLLTTAEDYALWMRYLLSAWPARDGGDSGPAPRATVREMAHGLNFPRLKRRPARERDDQIWLSATYGMGLDVALDPELGLTLSHSGGYPGYGSHMLMLPERGLGLFAFANRTYATPAPAVWDAARCWVREAAPTAIAADPPSDWLIQAHQWVQAMYAAGRVDAEPAILGMNFLLDREAASWALHLADLRQELGALRDIEAFQADGALAGSFVWRCAYGRLAGQLTLTPTRPPALQSLELSVVPPVA